MKRLNQNGSLHLVALVAVVAVLAVAFVGYRVWGNQHATKDAAQYAGVPAVIKSPADLKQVGKVLDDGKSQLDSSLDTSALDSDINSML